MLPTDVPRITEFFNSMEEARKKSKSFYDPMVRKENYVIPTGHLIICKVLVISSKQDPAYENFPLGVSPSDIYKNHSCNNGNPLK